MSALRALLLVFALLARPAPAHAEEAGMQSFVREVVARNPALRSQTLTQRSLHVRASAEGYLPDPEVSVMLDRVPQRHDGEMPMVRYQLTQMFMWPGKLGLMEAAAERQADAAAAEADAIRQRLVREAQQAYLMLVQNSGERGVNEAAQRLLDVVARAALARYGTGAGNHHDVTRAEVERGALELEQVALDGERASILAMLNALRDRPADAPLQPPSAPEAPPLVAQPDMGALLKLALSRRPELRRMLSMLREESTMADLARRERYPDLMAGVWYNQMLGEPDTGGVMVGARIPLFGVRRQNRRAHAADLAARAVDADLAGMHGMIRSQLADAWARLQTAQRTHRLVVTVAKPRAEQNFASALSAYGAATADLAFVLDAWRAMQRMEQARISALVQQQRAVVDLEWVVGGSLAGAAS